MRLLLSYLRLHLRQLAALALLAAVELTVFALYGLPMETLGYAFGLMLLAGLGFLAAGYGSYRARCEKLEACRRNIDLELGELPAPRDAAEACYQDMLRTACRSAATQRAATQRRQSAQTEYYTLWTHQIKTPIAAMRLLLQDEDGELARQLRPELFRIEQYVDMALNYARLDDDTGDLVIRNCALEGIVKQSVRKFAPLFIQKRLSLELTPMDCSVLTDEKWLGFAIDQVLSNAVKYTRQGSISIYAEDGPVLVIRDTGIGIAPEDLPRVFEHGYTGLNGREDRRATGIGLYLTRRALTRLGHDIALTSEPGKGTTVRIDLCAAPLDARD